MCVLLFCSIPLHFPLHFHLLFHMYNLTCLCFFISIYRSTSFYISGSKKHAGDIPAFHFACIFRRRKKRSKDNKKSSVDLSPNSYLLNVIFNKNKNKFRPAFRRKIPSKCFEIKNHILDFYTSFYFYLELTNHVRQ